MSSLVVESSLVMDSSFVVESSLVDASGWVLFSWFCSLVVGGGLQYVVKMESVNRHDIHAKRRKRDIEKPPRWEMGQRVGCLYWVIVNLFETVTCC